MIFGFIVILNVSSDQEKFVVLTKFSSTKNVLQKFEFIHKVPPSSSSTPPYSVYTLLYHECDSDTRIIDLIACTKIVFT